MLNAHDHWHAAVHVGGKGELVGTDQLGNRYYREKGARKLVAAAACRAASVDGCFITAGRGLARAAAMACLAAFIPSMRRRSPANGRTIPGNVIISILFYLFY